MPFNEKTYVFTRIILLITTLKYTILRIKEIKYE